MAGELDDWLVRPARAGDVDALLALAQLTGGGFTNLPPDRDELAARVDWSVESFAADLAGPDNELYMLVLEQRSTGAVLGTACLFSRVGIEWPFYSYRVATVSKRNKQLGMAVSARVLHLVNDYDGCSEVGGLFLHPGHRTGGLGRLLARSRYLFIARHRARFAGRVLAELRGVIDADGHSPFWDALAGKFFGMDFRAADQFNSVNGNQFIADLMPRHPVYVDLLTPEAQAVLGEPHPAGRAAMALLKREGFAHNGYVDIFDGGPTMDCRTDDIATVRGARRSQVVEPDAPDDAPPALVASGELTTFLAFVTPTLPGQETVRLGPAAPAQPPTEVLHVPF